MLRQTIQSTSRAEDAGYRAVHDIATMCAELQMDYRLIGGLSVALLYAAHGSPGSVPPRQTADADLGADHEVVAAAPVVRSLVARGYTKTAGNRFERGEDEERRAIDVLVPTIGGRMTSNVECGELTVDAIPGLALALTRPPVILDLTHISTDSKELTTDVLLPDPIASLVLKAYATSSRPGESDPHDIWRLLELVHHLSATPEEWGPMRGQRRDAARILHARFGQPGAPGMRHLINLGANASRITALVRAHVPVP